MNALKGSEPLLSHLIPTHAEACKRILPGEQGSGYQDDSGLSWARVDYTHCSLHGIESDEIQGALELNIFLGGY